MELPGVDAALKWFSGVATAVLVIFVPRLMALRSAASRDAAQRAADGALVSRSHAEAAYFDKALINVTKERDKWLERFEALGLKYERDIKERDRQIEKLWRRAIRYAPPDVKGRLEAEYEQTRPAPLDGLPPEKGRR